MCLNKTREHLAIIAILIALLFFHKVILMSLDFTQYVSHLCNHFDVIGSVLILAYCIYLKQNESFDIRMNYVMCTGLIFVNIRCIIHLSVIHAKLRKLIVIMTDSATDLIAFLAIIFVVVSIFSVS